MAAPSFPRTRSRRPRWSSTASRPRAPPHRRRSGPAARRRTHAVRRATRDARRPARARAGRSAHLAELDPAAQALGLGRGGRLAGEHGVERVLEVALLDLGGVALVVVDGAVIGELAV